ncbi:MAG: pyruvate dehydrogenase (acetyl-transferring) E1 component subunit alpha [Chloroflexi bacterium]|jgi:pyruvate dehydrogenase E1 component alpha subunit|nr:pyruvate dehydrogenase (acetyl-transferring) E1 component subunit alpha [Chloroflexota bacterium]MBT3668815.1 pyruvate dehydrogenase (acetyl-transferring) E1 component subunit alpha [Chloroflexota bacterium]MBT4003804.1 pyruvate dehydrogenase (acetyl-transferring) E1 component subunit alpha [Chloroflexota bacterium]MBT4306529.1 pyruvate dehydrogenase (acetyl-transferring) E1 component subunit alpha [Chloroflexota bacterium]MBT4533913.1 pyruvate dehydrogenase (acetyl-transferring) E1 componen
MNKQELLEVYRQMVMIRRLEERAAELYQQGKIGGFLHLYIGQEAVSTGLVAARQPQDRMITAYRDHGVAINVGISAKEVIAELLGKATGVSKGKGGSMHMADTEKNFFGGHAIVGAHLPIASGMALGDKYKKKDTVTICMFGDGATNIGYFHEGVNLSKVWDLPVLWVCENNQYGMGTTVERASAVSEIRQKAEGYGIPNERVDGMDVLAVHEATEKALKHIRAGKGPYFLEIMTYRYRGHSMGDPERYRDADEIKQWQESDPIGVFHAYLIENKKATKKALDEIEAQVEAEVEEAVEFAENSPDPAPEELFRDIYVEEN